MPLVIKLLGISIRIGAIGVIGDIGVIVIFYCTYYTYNTYFFSAHSILENFYIFAI